MSEGQMAIEEAATFTVSFVDDEGEEREIGKLTFDASNKGSLEDLAEGPEAGELKEAFDRVQTMDKVMLRSSRPTEVDGETRLVLVGREVGRDDPDYRLAVCAYLEAETGLEIDADD